MCDLPDPAAWYGLLEVKDHRSPDQEHISDLLANAFHSLATALLPDGRSSANEGNLVAQVTSY